MPNPVNIDELNRLYEEGRSADREIFAEMRSNVLLVAGDHYSRRGMSRTHNRLRTNSSLSENQKLRITKNHIHRAVRRYVGETLTWAPGVQVLPQQENEMQDQKAAEINQSVWLDGQSRYKFPEKKRNYCRSFHTLGEVCVILKWDPNSGDFMGYQQALNPETGELALDETGQPSPDTSAPVFSGAFIFEEVYAFNLTRHPAARSMVDSECWTVDKMVDLEVLKAKYADDKDKLAMLNESGKTDFIVFDADRASYEKSKGQVLYHETYWPISNKYPEGYYVHWIEGGNKPFEEGPLPFGIWPIAWKAADEYATTPRGRSVIKVARPYQAEINRASSAMAMHQITIGDDKVLYQKGSKLEQGALLPGVRGIAYAGSTPTILPGRDGGQYLPYIESQIAELDRVLMIEEESIEKNTQQDVEAALFRKMEQQKRFAEYGTKFEEFQIDLVDIFLKLARKYYTDDMYIVAASAKERINIQEFRSTSPLSYKIKLEARDETHTTQFGKYLEIKHLLQYSSGSLSRDDIGRLMRVMPFTNKEEALGDFTIDYDVVRNDMLAMERGQMPPMGKYDDPSYVLKKLSKRSRDPDFQFLDPAIQELYAQRIAQYEQLKADQAKAVADAKNEFIPTGGAMITCDLYVQDKEDPSKSNRARLPYQALQWLIDKLEAQGSTLQELESQNQGVLTEMAQMLTKRAAPQLVSSPQGRGPQRALDGASRGTA